MNGAEVQVGEHVVLGLVRRGGELWHLQAELVGDGAPLGMGCYGILVHVGGTDPHGDDRQPADVRSVMINVLALLRALAHVRREAIPEGKR